MNLQATHSSEFIEAQDRRLDARPAGSDRTPPWLPDPGAMNNLKCALSRESWLGQFPLLRPQQLARRRQAIYRAGEILEGIPVVCDGWASRVCRLSDGRRQILSFILPGNLVSTNAVFMQSLNFFVEAITPVRYSFYDRADFNRRLSSAPSLITTLVGACLLEKEEADQLATNLGRRPAEERIARLFLHLRGRLEMRGLVRNQSFSMPLRQQHIADATGLTPVHVNRVIGSLRNKGLIEMAGGVLTICDLAGLRRLADDD
jgi:CRP-like cAMP-binding protein